MLPFSAVIPMDVENQAYVAIRAEERIRPIGTDIKSAEEEIDPSLRYDYVWKGGSDHFVTLYRPRLIYQSSWDRRFPDPTLVNPNTYNTDDPNKTPFSALHFLGLGYEHNRPRYRVTLYGNGAYGQISTTALLVPDPWVGEGPPLDPNPVVPSTIGARFTLIFAQVTLNVPIRLSPRTALIPGVNFNAFGGADQKSRGVIALSEGPGASLQLDHLATKQDRLISTIGAGRVENIFQDERDGITIYRAEATQAWRHYFSSHWTSELSGGTSIGGDGINGYTIFTEGMSWVTWDSWPVQRQPPGAAPAGGEPGHGGHLQVGAVAKVQPWIDLFSGDLEQRLVTGVAMNYGMGRAATRLSLSQARVVNTPRSVAQYQVVFGEGAVKYQIVPTFSVDTGVRVAYQDFNNAIRFNELTQVTAFVGLTYSPLAYRWNP
ncbi:MAG: hypothetical protein U0270_44315 [Labilithrix sp.]